MLWPRIIPCLLIHNKRLVKTLNFRINRYLGDPLNTVKIFNEKEVDELVIIDIGATVDRKDPDYGLIEKLAAECRMPLCYGGGVKTIDQAKKILSLGVEKIAISSAILENLNLVCKIVEKIGSQSLVAVLDFKRKIFSKKYNICTHNATKNHPVNINNLLQDLVKKGIGEIMINSIDNDGVMKGYDLDLLDSVKSFVSVPITILGGAGSLEDMASVISRYGMIGVAAGSFFVFKGAYKAVLANYPNMLERQKIIEKSIKSYLSC